MYLDKAGIAKHYAVCPRTITDWMSRGRIPYLKLSYKMLRFDPAECDAALEKFKIHPPN
jgi:predicted site-specific integrase-resolvase